MNIRNVTRAIWDRRGAIAVAALVLVMVLTISASAIISTSSQRLEPELISAETASRQLQDPVYRDEEIDDSGTHQVWRSVNDHNKTVPAYQ